MLLPPVLAILVIVPLAAQASRDSTVPDLATLLAAPRSELAPIVERWSSDRAALGRRYAIEYSPQRRDRIRQFQRSWLGQLGTLDFEPERLLLSFHGMPERTLHLGDPYHCHCQKTARLLGEQLSLPVDVAFQSRFGRAKWLEPATEDVLAAYPRQGVRRIAIAAPGFSADCLETVEELGVRGRETFLAAGGTDFARLDCLNAGEEGMAMLDALLRRELAGWWEEA